MRQAGLQRFLRAKHANAASLYASAYGHADACFYADTDASADPATGADQAAISDCDADSIWQRWGLYYAFRFCARVFCMESSKCRS